MDQIYLHIFSIFAEKKSSQEPVHEDKEENKKKRKKLKLLIKLYFALCIIVTNRIHIYQPLGQIHRIM